MTTYLSRSNWTSTSASGDRLSKGNVVGVAVHWPGTKQRKIGDPGKSAVASRIRGYRDYHVNSRGWRDIGYNVIIDQAGRIWMGRSTAYAGNMSGAHCASTANPRANDKYVGVLLLLGKNEKPSSKMIEAFRHWYHNKFLKAYPGRTDVRGHGQVYGASTACPGSYARSRLSELTKKPGGGSSKPKPKPKKGKSVPRVDLSKLREASRQDPPRRSYLARYPTGTKLVEKALQKEGLLNKRWFDRVGHFGSKTVSAYAAWQRRCGYRGADADGIPGRESLTKLGKRYGFGVKN